MCLFYLLAIVILFCFFVCGRFYIQYTVRAWFTGNSIYRADKFPPIFLNIPRGHPSESGSDCVFVYIRLYIYIIVAEMQNFENDFGVQIWKLVGLLILCSVQVLYHPVNILFNPIINKFTNLICFSFNFNLMFWYPIESPLPTRPRLCVLLTIYSIFLFQFSRFPCLHLMPGPFLLTKYSSI